MRPVVTRTIDTSADEPSTHAMVDEALDRAVRASAEGARD
jgi:hypothetical protein